MIQFIDVGCMDKKGYFHLSLALTVTTWRSRMSVISLTYSSFKYDIGNEIV